MQRALGVRLHWAVDFPPPFIAASGLFYFRPPPRGAERARARARGAGRNSRRSTYVRTYVVHADRQILDCHRQRTRTRPNQCLRRRRRRRRRLVLPPRPCFSLTTTCGVAPTSECSRTKCGDWCSNTVRRSSFSGRGCGTRCTRTHATHDGTTRELTCAHSTRGLNCSGSHMCVASGDTSCRAGARRASR